MEESPGKAAARAFFYQHCLPRWLSPEQCASGNALVLLGDGVREIPYLDERGIPRSRVYSVERSLETWRIQDRWNVLQSARNRVNLHFGTVSEYVEFRIHDDQGFTILNLDIEGSYLQGIDPVMTSVLLHSWFNPMTVVATYHSCGRDRSTLAEGVVALALLRALAPSETSVLVERILGGHYAAASTGAPIRMLLRELAWFASIAEHAVRTSVVLGTVPPSTLTAIASLRAAAWSRVVRRLPSRALLTLPYVMQILLESRDEFELLRAPLQAPIAIGIELGFVQRLTYNAARTWTQLCTFATFLPSTTPISLWAWVEGALSQYIASPLIHVDRSGILRSVSPAYPSTFPASLTLWQDDRIRSYVPRTLPALRVDRSLAHRIETRRALTRPAREEHIVTKRMPAKRPRRAGRALFVLDGALTPAGVAEVRRLAAEGCTTRDILVHIPTAPERVVRAHVAVAHRTPKA